MLLRNKSFLLLMAGEVIGGVGIWLAIVANLQFMQGIISSDFIKSLILMTGIFASVVFLPHIGKIVDRHDKRIILIISNIVRCLSPLLMFPALHYNSIPWMIASLILLQISGATYFPAVRTSLPALVDREQLLVANTFHMNAITISRIAGTAIAGIMVAKMSLHSIYMVSLIGYLILVGLFLFIRIPKKAEQGAQGSKDQGKMKFSEVFSVIRGNRPVMIGIVITGMVNLFLGGLNLLILSISTIQDAPKLLGYMYTVEGTCILIAGLFVRKVIGKANLITTSALLLFMIALAQLSISFVHYQWTVLAGFGLFGIMVAFFFPMVTTIFQKQIPSEMHGRFFSFKEIIDRILFQVALLATGACFDLFGTSIYVMILAGLTAFTGFISFSQAKKFKLNVRQY